MAKIMLYDTDSRKPVGEKEIPDDVLDACSGKGRELAEDSGAAYRTARRHSLRRLGASEYGFRPG